MFWKKYIKENMKLSYKLDGQQESDWSLKFETFNLAFSSKITGTAAEQISLLKETAERSVYKSLNDRVNDNIKNAPEFLYMEYGKSTK